MITYVHFIFSHFRWYHFCTLLFTKTHFSLLVTSSHFSSLYAKSITFYHFINQSLLITSGLTTVYHFMMLLHTYQYYHFLSLFVTFRTCSLFVTFHQLFITLRLTVSFFRCSLTTSLSTAETCTKRSQVPHIK